MGGNTGTLVELVEQEDAKGGDTKSEDETKDGGEQE